MKVEVWSDFVCPFCYIGERNLETALKQLSLQSDVEVEFKSFELDPSFPPYSGVSVYEVLASKYGMTIEKARESQAQVSAYAKEVGLDFNVDGMKLTNTLDAHRMAKLAKEQGRDEAFVAKVFAAFFTEGENIGDRETLVRIAKEAGIDSAEAERVFDDKDAFLNDVRADEGTARLYGVTSVPYFVFDQKYSISGAQPLESFVGALQRAWGEREAK